MEITYRPLERWDRNGPETPRMHSPFRAGWSQTIEQLERECWKLDADHVIVELALPEAAFRLDGRPRSGAYPEHPGVTVAIDSGLYGPLKYTADKFSHWQENLRAIALGLEALRKVDRYGITTRGEQYAGWKALPAGGPSAERGEQLIEEHGGVKAALFKTHPDHGGDARDFGDVMAAKELTA